MNRASVGASVGEVEKALEDPEVARAARVWFERERAMTDVAVQITKLEERGARDEAEKIEEQVPELRKAMDTAARELDVVAGEQLASRLRRMKEEAFMAKAKEIGRGHGDYKPCPDCSGVLRGSHRRFCKGKASAQPAPNASPAAAPKRAPVAPPALTKASIFRELGDLCDALKEKLAERDALDELIRELGQKIGEASAR